MISLEVFSPITCRGPQHGRLCVVYGLRKIRVPALSLLIISLASGAGIWTAMAAGNLIAGTYPMPDRRGRACSSSQGFGLSSRIGFKEARPEADSSG